MPEGTAWPCYLRPLINPEVRAVQAGASEDELLAAYECVWERKRLLRDLYGSWYQRIADRLRPGTTVEIGAGTGNFKRWLAPRRVHTSDILRGRWVDVCADATALPFAPSSVDNIVVIDTLHHLGRPRSFVREATAALRPGGRLILLEPYASPWGAVVYRYLHHERVDFAFSEDAPKDAAWDGNAAIPRLLLDGTNAPFPHLRLIVREHLEMLAYPLSGGFSYRSLLPAPVLQAVRRAERPLAVTRWFALRVFAVFERE